MTGDNGPRKDDLVQVTYKGRYEPTPHGALLVTEGSPKRSIFEDAVVEVLERADDPSKDGIGTVRTSPAGVVVARQFGAIGWAVIWDCGATDYDHYLDEQVSGWPVTGAVPGTPAAEAEARLRSAIEEQVFGGGGLETPRPSVRLVNEPHGLPIDVRNRAAAELATGHVLNAIGIVKHAVGDWTTTQAREYVQSLPEFESYLSEHGETREPRRVFVLENAAEGWEPSDEDVKVWRWLDAETTKWEFLHRVDGGWLWSQSAVDVPPIQASPNTFVDATKACLGRYEEVLS